ncbi:MAG: hypothetical protein NTW19_13530 [Planctomycetota bacterium]|nr:hypothetical protein [Planctomycetota bacterium]
MKSGDVVMAQMTGVDPSLFFIVPIVLLVFSVALGFKVRGICRRIRFRGRSTRERDDLAALWGIITAVVVFIVLMTLVFWDYPD